MNRGFVLKVVFFAFVNSFFGWAIAEDCRSVLSDSESSDLLREEEIDVGVLCFTKVHGSQYARIYYFKRSSGVLVKVEENSDLVLLDEVVGGGSFPSFSYENGKLQVLFVFPRNVYWANYVEKNGRLVISDVGESVRLGMADGESVEESLNFIEYYQDGKGGLFSDHSRDELFELKGAALVSEDVGKRVLISVDKALLHTKPNADAASGMYLIKGDKVLVREYKDGWLLVDYVTSKRKLIRQWIKMGDLI